MKAIKYIIFGFIFFSLGSCQKEEETIIQDNTQSFVANAPIAGLLSRTSQNPTSLDNVLDNSSCFSVQLPVTVIVNGQQITVNDQADYQIVQAAIDEFSDDDDLVNFVYPITIIYQNFQTQVLQDADDLDDVIDDCGEDDGFDEIDCITLVYPITINIYDSNNQLANTVTINSNSNLFNFLANLGSNTYVAINYPISAVNSNGQTVVINSNSELENFIEDSIDDCDDDNSGGSGGSGSSAFTDVLTSGTWYISYYFEDDDDETSDFNGYTFTFNSNGTSTALRNGVTTNGTWSTFVDSGQNKLDLIFNGINLDEIEDDWRIIEYSNTQIRLKDVSGGDGSIDYLTFTKN
ncbi:hypothetical protein IVB69_06490 [Flavobacterium sp. J49]|uniref:hypothetical protein n=1 Tax=Flavobacterium sp. J49 TaxID=2718534 RepID=UPI0015932FC0|nr:hypothetical protein [Flavobacterium sp. J49]MBF6641121.1 hypothetical protein [Flavobacterium sp. J49]NIC02368.1 hypothetical protein [Flavobacterium sp. J49]